MEDYKDFRENILYKISMTILEYIVISLFVIIVSVLSFGLLFYTALSSSYYYYYKKQREHTNLQFKYLLKGISLNYKQSIPLNIAQLVIFYIGYVNMNNFELFPESRLLYYIIIFSSIILTLVIFYILQLTTYFNITIHNAVGLSSYFIFSYLFSTFTIIILLIALIFSISLQPSLMLIVIGLFIQLSSYIFISIFKNHLPEEVNKHEEKTP